MEKKIARYKTAALHKDTYFKLKILGAVYDIPMAQFITLIVNKLWEREQESSVGVKEIPKVKKQASELVKKLREIL